MRRCPLPNYVATLLFSPGAGRAAHHRQVLLKISLQSFGRFEWSWRFFAAVFTNLRFALCGLSFAAASLLWAYIMRRFPFSTAYPTVSLSYVFALIAAVFVFDEQVPPLRWVGCACIVFGVWLTTR